MYMAKVLHQMLLSFVSFCVTCHTWKTDNILTAYYILQNSFAHRSHVGLYNAFTSILVLVIG